MTTRKDKLVALAEHLMAYGSAIFNEKGPDEIMPMFEGENEKGEHFIIGAPISSNEEKPIIAKAVRQLFRDKQVLRYVFLSEGWVRTATPEEASNINKINPRVSEHEDRRECLTVVGTDGITSVYMCRYILRPEHGKPCLTPIETSTSEAFKDDNSLFGSLLTTVE